MTSLSLFPQATATVVVTVTDINDNDPMFTVGPTVTYYRPETSTGPVSIQTFSATDMDVGLNAAIQYSVTSDDSGVFYFNSVGCVCVCVYFN